MKTGAIVLMLLLGLASVCRAQSTSSQLLDRAIARYTEAMDASRRDDRVRGFGAAELLFQQAIDVDPADASVALYVNLGNAALQAEHIGTAIAAYRQALALDPTHSQALQNLNFARAAVPESFRHETRGGLVNTLFFWTALYSREQVMGAAALCFLLAAVALALGMAWRQPLFRNLAVIPFIGWAVCLISLLVAQGSSNATDAVVIAGDVVLRSADSENAPPRLSESLSSGVEVRVLRERDRWTEVEIPGGRTGWVLDSAVKRL